jgi:hypothetical protein
MARAPVIVDTVLIGVEFFPDDGIANENAVDGAGASAGKGFVVVVVADWIGVAEEGIGGAGVACVEGVEFDEFGLGLRDDEGGIEIEADVIETPAGDGDEFHAKGVFFLAGGGGDEKREVIRR